MNRAKKFEVDARNLVDEENAVNALILDDYEFLTETLGFDPFADEADEVEEASLQEVTVLDALLGAERRWLQSHEVSEGDECDVGAILDRALF